MTTVAEVVASGVVRERVPFVFGHPGGEVVALIDALERAGVRFILDTMKPKQHSLTPFMRVAFRGVE